MENSVEYTLSSYQSAQVALFMLDEYNKYLKEHQISILNFKDWLNNIK